MALCDNKVERQVKSYLPGLLSPVIPHYIWVVPAGVTLPEGIHLSRDELWAKNEAVPHGHQTFNATRNFENGEGYMQRIKDLNDLGVLVAEVTYTAKTDFVEEGEVMLRRSRISWRVDGLKYMTDAVPKYAKLLYV